MPNLRLALEFRGLIDDQGRAVPIPPDAVARRQVAEARLARPAVEVAFRLQQELDDAINTGRLPFDLTVYRGIRSVRRTFGVEDAASIGSAPRRFRGFTATFVLRQVALEEFTAPTGALMEIPLPAGTQGRASRGAGRVVA